MNIRSPIPHKRYVVLFVVALAIILSVLSISGSSQTSGAGSPNDVGCCCNGVSGQSQKPTILTRAECDSTNNFNFTFITQSPPYDITTICTTTCGAETPAAPNLTVGISQCGDQSFKPNATNVAVYPIRGTRNLRVTFETPCPAQTNGFLISRCEGTYDQCVAGSFKDLPFAAPNNPLPPDQRGIKDTDQEIKYHQDYTYKVVVSYKFSGTSVPATSAPSFATGNAGDLECDAILSDENFCIGGSGYYAKEPRKSYLQSKGYAPFSAQAFSGNDGAFNVSVSNAFGGRFNAAYGCTVQNTLQKKLQCGAGAPCIVQNNQPQCRVGEDCHNLSLANVPFGLGFDVNNCEKDIRNGQPRYCYFDRSKSIANDCFDCDSRMSCYDYRTAGACRNDNCGVGGQSRATPQPCTKDSDCGGGRCNPSTNTCFLPGCIWTDIYPSIGIGVCKDPRYSNCYLCDSRGLPTLNPGAYNEIFDVCTPTKNLALSIPPPNDYPCTFRRGGGPGGQDVSTDCKATTCSDYNDAVEGRENACKSPTEGILLGADNTIVRRSNDSCGLGVCQFVSGTCVKNADGKENSPSNPSDCINNERVTDIRACELDTVPAVTSIIPLSQREGRTDALLIQRRDALNRTMSPADVSDDQLPGYPMWYCTYPTGGTPCSRFNINTTSKSLAVMNTMLIDGTQATAILSVGSNVIRYYTEDPSHNLEIIKEATFSACANCQGPDINSSSVQNAIKDERESRWFTRDTAPVVTVQFRTPSRVTRGSFLQLDSSSGAVLATVADVSARVGAPGNTIYTFTPPAPFPATTGTPPGPTKVIFGVIASDIASGIPMERDFLVNITIDNVQPRFEALIVDPSEETTVVKRDINGIPVFFAPHGAITVPYIPGSMTKIALNFSEFVTLDDVSAEYNNFTLYTSKPGTIRLAPFFTTPDNKTFTIESTSIPDGSNTLVIRAHDRATNIISARIPFISASGPPGIRLVTPSQGGTATQPFTLEAATLNPASCKFYIKQIASTDISAIDPERDYTAFRSSGDTRHVQTGIVLPRQGIEYPLYIYCKDAVNRQNLETFSLVFDPSPPIFNTTYPQLFPVNLYESPAITTLTAVTNKPSFCRYDFAKGTSAPTNSYASMRFTFPDFNQSAKHIHLKDLEVTDYSNVSTTDYTVVIGCVSRANLGPALSGPLRFRVVPNVRLALNITSKSLFNATPVDISAETNKRANCIYEEAGSNFPMEVDQEGQSSTKHRATVDEREGTHTGTISCQPAGNTIGTITDTAVSIPLTYTVDLSRPQMIYVNDSSSFSDPQVTVLQDRLLLSWYGNDTGTGVAIYNVTIKNGTNTLQTVKSYYTTRHYNATYVPVQLADLTRYQATVIAIDRVQRESDPLSSDGVTTNFGRYPLHCSNNALDSDSETDTDCGDECAPCGETKRCNADADCQSLSCTGTEGAKTCAPSPTCGDGKKNADETDIDCGGGYCGLCNAGQTCILRSDCKNHNNNETSMPILLCAYQPGERIGRCATAPACDNLIIDGSETGVDCGGSCKACPDGSGCRADSDCKGSTLRPPTSLCNRRLLVKLNYSSAGNPESYQELQLNLTGTEDQMRIYLRGLYGTNTTFSFESQIGVCEDQVTDSDGDGMPDWWEDKYNLDKNNRNDAANDNDQDALVNVFEYNYYNASNKTREINPLRADTDNDGYTDPEEIAAQTNPVDPASHPAFHDLDRDGMSDLWEQRYELNPVDPSDKTQDPDADNQTNFQEFNYTLNFGTLQENKNSQTTCDLPGNKRCELNPKGALRTDGKFSGYDTDGDGWPDGVEVKQRPVYDPLDVNMPPRGMDTDGDGIPDWYERKHDLNPNNRSDADRDYDLDNMSNLLEYRYFLTSNITFGQVREIDPQNKDTDNDGFPDGLEVRAGTNPIDKDDPPADYAGPTITLNLPPLGVIASQPFIMQAGTNLNSTCRYWFTPVIPPQTPPSNFQQLSPFDQTNAYNHTKNSVSGIKTQDLFKNFPLFVACIDSFMRTRQASFNLSMDTTAPTIQQAYSDPEPISQKPIATNLIVITSRPSFCKYSTSTTDYNAMDGAFPGLGFDATTTHSAQVNLSSPATTTFNIACKNPAGVGPTSTTITVHVDQTTPLAITRNTKPILTSSTVLISVRTNKDALCDYLGDDNSQTSFGSNLARTHDLTIEGVPEGVHNGTVRCTTPSDVSFSNTQESAELPFGYIVDSRSPVMDVVDDSGPNPNNTRVSYFINGLRVRWDGHDDTSGIGAFYVSLTDAQGRLMIDRAPRQDKNITTFFLVPNLTNQQTYIFTVFAQDRTGLNSTPLSSDGVQVLFNETPSHCSNSIFDAATESDRDCGKECAGCANGLTCNQTVDCQSGFCNPTTNKCAAPTCSDGFRQTPETDIDCGGSAACSGCGEGKTCIVGTDCAGNLTCTQTVCTRPTSCQNNQRDAGESDIDCGGTCQNKCGDGKICRDASDCAAPLSCVTVGASKTCTDPGTDADRDGMPDSYETRHGLNPNNPADAAIDSDGDGLTNLQEYNYFKNSLATFNQTREINPKDPDTDHDGATDNEEIIAGFNPVDPNNRPVLTDTDRDGMPDSWERNYSFNAFDASDAAQDADGEGLTNLQEYQYFRDRHRPINPRAADTDGDTFNDKAELDAGTDPTNPNDKPTPAPELDTDKDGMPDSWENRAQLNPNDPSDAARDDDSDGLTNLREYQYFRDTNGKYIDPRKADTDNDGFNDKIEIDARSDPTDPRSTPDEPDRGCRRRGTCPPPTDQTDRDGDGMFDTWETRYGLDRNNASDANIDSDGDGLTNLEEFNYFRNTGKPIDPKKADTDGDGFNDKAEIDAKTDPTDPASKPKTAPKDTDGDGMPDDWETKYKLDPNNNADAAQDLDADGLTNKQEYDYFRNTNRDIDPRKADTDNDGFNDKEEIDAGTDPTDASSKPSPRAGRDSDNDGIPDDWERANGLDPANPADANRDNDGDGLTNKQEYEWSKQTGKPLNPNKKDTDDDGYTDKAEIESGTDPTDARSKPTTVAPPAGAKDTDGDGIPDDYERDHGLDPNDPADAARDDDGDGLTNREEYNYFKRTNKFIDPHKADTDGDGATDKEEVDAGTDPLDKNSYPSDLDSDKDGMPDVWELRHNLNPNDPSDANADPGRSGMTNLQKYQYYKLTGKDILPLKADSDGDGWSDKDEIAANTDPVDPLSHPKSKLVILLWIILILVVVAGGGYAIWYLIQQQQEEKLAPRTPTTPFKPAARPIQPYPPIQQPTPAWTPAPKTDEYKVLGELAPTKAPGAYDITQDKTFLSGLTAMERLAIEGLPEFEREKLAAQFEKLRKGLLSKEERELLFKKLREIAKYWSLHKDELERQKAIWLASKGVSLKPKPSTIPSITRPATTTMVKPTAPAAKPAAAPARALTVKPAAAKPTTKSLIRPVSKPAAAKPTPAKASAVRKPAVTIQPRITIKPAVKKPTAAKKAPPKKPTSKK